MATAHPIEPAAAVPAKPLRPSTAALADPPWIADDGDAPISPQAAPRPPARRAQRKAASDPAPEPVHWSIVALTVGTVLSILFGSHGVEPSRAKESPPVMVFAPSR